MQLKNITPQQATIVARVLKVVQVEVLAVRWTTVQCEEFCEVMDSLSEGVKESVRKQAQIDSKKSPEHFAKG